MSYYYFKDFKIDIFGYNPETKQCLYCVETKYSSKVRKARIYDTIPRTRSGDYQYINIITPDGKTKRLYLK